jgi:hypothetical protein
MITMKRFYCFAVVLFATLAAPGHAQARPIATETCACQANYYMGDATCNITCFLTIPPGNFIYQSSESGISASLCESDEIDISKLKHCKNQGITLFTAPSN